MNVEEIQADLAATVDYIREQVTERSDTADFDDLVAMADAVMKVQKACRDALSLIETAQINQLEAGARQIGTRVFTRVPKRVYRFNHGFIRNKIKEIARQRAIDTETGVLDTEAMADQLNHLMAQIYIAPATKAKVTELEKLGISIRDARTSERKGFEIKVIDTEGEDDGDDD